VIKVKENEVIMKENCCSNSMHSIIIRVGKLLFISHELPLDPATGELITDDFEKAVKVCLENLRTDIESLGTKVDNIISTTLYVNDHEKVNKLEQFFIEQFGNKPPAKKIIEGEVEGNLPIRIDAVAIVR
jgi:2-iminobutanoate/2-iminopropanoate deaminase